MNSDTTERYDRQIRLWGNHGQSKCANSKICLINANSLGAEVLKGLCLAGIASFTILDSHKLTHEDMGSIFIQSSCLRKNRGESVRQMLLDLNDQVTGEVYPVETYLPHDTSLSKEDPEVDHRFWSQFNCIIAAGFLYIDQMTRLSDICWSLNVPLILCKSIGFFGSMRIQVEEHYVIETHPENSLPCFSIDRPFQELKKYFDSISLEQSDISKYPYIVIIYKYLKEWQSQNGHSGSRLPTSFEEKRALKNLINEGLKVKVSKMLNEELSDSSARQDVLFENYMDAMKAVNTCFTDSVKLPTSVECLFNHPKVTKSENVSSFWLIIKAIKQFVLQKNDGMLPISGNIPDMTSSSKEYITILGIYSKKAHEDLDNVFSIVTSLANSTNSKSSSSLYEETKLICKNIRDIRVIGTNRIGDEYDLKGLDIRDNVEGEEYVAIELGMRALDLFYSTYGRPPGRQLVETDIGKYKDCLKLIFGRASNKFKNIDEFLYELCRYGGAELHATSAFLGGCITQEVIKFITNQYLTVDDTMVYNAMTASAHSFKFREIFSK